MGIEFLKVIWLNKNIYNSRIGEFLIDLKVFFTFVTPDAVGTVGNNSEWHNIM
jgi:hypothetical protein